MRISFSGILLPIALIGEMVFATPVEPHAVPRALIEVGPLSLTSTSILDLPAGKSNSIIHAATTVTPNTGFNDIEARDGSGQYLLLCTSINCGTCYRTQLLGLAQFTCYEFTIAAFLSAGITKPASSDFSTLR